jgi:hypothetical protein
MHEKRERNLSATALRCAFSHRLAVLAVMFAGVVVSTCGEKSKVDEAVPKIDRPRVERPAVDKTETMFVYKGDGTVLDRVSGLVWIKDPSAVPSISGEFDQDEAEKACSELNFARHDDWRLPEIDELKTIVDKSRNPAWIEQLSGPPGSYWSATEQSAPIYYYVDFTTGNDYFWGGFNKIFIRPVRGGLDRKNEAVGEWLNEGEIVYLKINDDATCLLKYEEGEYGTTVEIKGRYQISGKTVTMEWDREWWYGKRTVYEMRNMDGRPVLWLTGCDSKTAELPKGGMFGFYGKIR